MFVDALIGSDSSTCGNSSATACRSIQQAIDNIQEAGVMLCISEGQHLQTHLATHSVLQAHTMAVSTMGGQRQSRRASPSRGLVVDLRLIAKAEDLHSAFCPTLVLLSEAL